MDKRKVELIFDATEAPSFDSNLQDIERKQAEALRRMQGGIDIGAAGMSGGAMSPGMALPPSASHDALQNALGSTGGDVPWRELVDAVRALTEITSESADTARKTNETARRNLAWQQANALMNLGNQTVNQVAQGNFFGAAGGAVGGLLGLPFGPAGMAAGASIGGMAGNFLQGLSTGAGGARAYTADATDLARRFGGLDQLSPLQDYGLGSEQGYKVEETLSQMGRLQASRVAGNAGEAAQLIPAIQQLTRALGLNAEATIDLYQGYVQTGGDRGSDGLRDYMAQVVGGAISAGFESNIQMYGEFMNSARTQSVSQSGSLMSDRAFGQLQGVLANLTGTDSQASRFFKENPQFAQAGMSTYMAMGGAGDPYSTQAGYLRLAGVEEHQIDRRFINQETQMSNAGKAMGFLGDQMMQYSGMSREQFQAAAAADPNFVREQMSGNVNLQRLRGTQLLPGLIGRDATAQDMRAFEQLSNIAISNGGQLPTGTADGAGQVDKLLAQLNASPADAARQAEAERHNKQMEVMANFQNLMTKTDEWMANIYGWISENLDLAAIEETVLSVMNRFGNFVTDTALPFIEDQAIPFIQDQAIPFVMEGLDAAKALAQWAKDNNIAEKAGRVGRIAGMRSYEEFTSGDTGVGFDGKFDGPLSNFVRGVAARFNDTPGHGVTAREGYNTFQFAEGDQVFAFQGGGNTLGDLLKALEDILGVGIEYTELTKELHDERFTLAAEQFDLLALTEEHQAAITEYQTEQTEKIFPLMEAHLGAIADSVSLMAGIDQTLRDLTGVTVDIATMVNTLQMSGMGMMGAAAGGGSGVAQFPIRGMTLDDARITSGFGWRNIFGRRDFHEGIDIGVSGGTDVLAARSGTVSQIKPLADQLQIAIQSVNERGQEIEEWYIHTSDALVEVGDRVTAGQKIAEVAHTSSRARAARVSTGDHLDYRVRVDGDWVDPTTMLQGLPAGGTAPPTTGGGTFNPNVPADFQNKVNQVAGRLGANPDYLMAVMGFETGGSYDPSIRNGAGSGATGLIQFMPSTATGLGTSTSALAGMSQLEQLDYVEKYLQPYAGQLNSLEDTYMSVLYPAAIGQGAGHTLFNRGTTAYRQNSGLDINEDGRITVGEATNKVREYLPASGGSATAASSNTRTAAAVAAYTPPFARAATSTSGSNRSGGSVTLNITVNVNGSGSRVRDEAYEGAAAAVDEFEQRWRSESARHQPESAGDYSYS